MNLFELSAKIKLDAREYYEGIKSATNDAKATAQSMANLQLQYTTATQNIKELSKALSDYVAENGDATGGAKELAFMLSEEKQKAAEALDAINRLKKGTDAGAQSALDMSDEAQDLSGQLKDTKKQTDNLRKSTEDLSNDKSFESWAERSRRALSTIAKVGAAAVAAAGAAVVAVTKQAVEAYANYEQLVGGVETLFGAGGQSLQEYADSVGKSVDDVEDEYNSLIQSQETVLQNARSAYKTAGLSANEYMETVTSFSASLLQSLGGDTEAAAKVSDRAITDMADNANKMGTAMESIQNAYQGFAKQNYTMLDNLKLGYGGTKEEMARLIADAAKLTNVQEELGITVDANSMSFANIVNAISVTQKQMGIMGTTSKEAASTIQGSISTMKGAWNNLLIGMADDEADMETLMDDFVESVVTVGNNLVPRIKTTINGITTFITKSSVTLIPEVVNTLVDNIPDLLEAGFTLAKALVGALFDPENVYKAVYSAVDLILSLIEELSNAVGSAEGVAAIEAFAVSLVKAIWSAIGYHFKKNFDEFTKGVSDEYGLHDLGIQTQEFLYGTSSWKQADEVQNKISDQLAEIKDTLANTQVVLNTGELVGGLSTGIDTALGQTSVASSRRSLRGGAAR